MHAFAQQVSAHSRRQTLGHIFDPTKRTVFFPSTMEKEGDFACWQMHDLPGHEQFANLREFIFGHENQILIFCINAQDPAFYNHDGIQGRKREALNDHLMEWLSRAVDSRIPLVFVVLSHVDSAHSH
eukprot:GABV01014527.1.p1 GENE.GABV01014527.1~~GABV01014527.1.p1  ORF type:complete len:127 (-),score=45.33 GABV01014527.1:11-391(-)